MPWDETPAVTYFTATPGILVTFPGFDLDTEFGVIDTWSLGMGWIPKKATCLITTTVGTTAAIDVDVDVSMDNSKFEVTDINNITAKDTYESHPASGAADDKAEIAWRHWKVLINTVGANNELSAALWLHE